MLTSKFPSAFKVFSAWLPIYGVWVLWILTYAEEATVTGALRAGAYSIGWAATLGVGVWWFTGRTAWPERIRLSFYLLHLLVGSVYAIAWLLVGYVMESRAEQRDLLDALRQSDVLGWQYLMGLWLYGLVAGVSYAVRIRGRLREQERIAARAETLAAETRLQALRAQVNPHFLFNALHSLSTLIRHDPGAAQQSVDRLGDLLRYALDEESGDEVLLEEEWAFTEDYLDLERIRFGDRLAVSAELSSEALACSVPPFTLQPLVENAIRHGIAPESGGGRITVAARVDGESLHMTVWDDGPGVRHDAGVNGSGLGLKTLRERLDALYGDQASVDVEWRDGDGFLATVTLPAEDGTVGRMSRSDGEAPGSSTGAGDGSAS